MAIVLHPEFQLYEKRDMPFCSSLQVAEEFGKRHDNVLADIKNLDCSRDFYSLNFQEIRRTVDLGDGRTRKDPMFLLTKDGFMFLVMMLLLWPDFQAMRFQGLNHYAITRRTATTNWRLFFGWEKWE